MSLARPMAWGALLTAPCMESPPLGPTKIPSLKRTLSPMLVSLGIAFAAGCSAPTATRSSTGQVGGAQLTAVYSRASKDYVRAQRTDGTFETETYVFKDGGNFGGPRVDVTMDQLTFDDVTKVIARPLAAQNYLQGDEPASAKLLIMVYWGVTVVPDDVNPYNNRESRQLGAKAERARASDMVSANNYATDAAVDAHMEAMQDAVIDAKSANILGYTDEILRTREGDPNMITLHDEIERDRYYVVLLAYDNQAARRFGRHELLWETRFSIPEPGNDFEKAFPTMASIAGKYFGQDSHGLIHHNLADTHVDVGTPTSLGAVPEK
jgi:hypothetical protein